MENTDPIEESPQPSFLAIESEHSSLKKKLQSVPMLDYDFCSATVDTDYQSDREPPPLDERKPAAVRCPMGEEPIKIKDGPEDMDEGLAKAIALMEQEGNEEVKSDVAMTESEDLAAVGALTFGGFKKDDRKSDDDSDGYDDLFSMDKESESNKVLSAEILVAIATKSKLEFKTFRGLIDTGTSASLMKKKLIPEDNEESNEGRYSQWKTQAGTFKTKGRVQVKKVKLPQFTTKRTFQAEFHLFEKKDNDQYHFILGRDILQKIKLNVLFSDRVFEWDHICVDMVPRGHWS